MEVVSDGTSGFIGVLIVVIVEIFIGSFFGALIYVLVWVDVVMIAEIEVGGTTSGDVDSLVGSLLKQKM